MAKQRILCVGFSPSVAVLIWLLSQSDQFEVYTYWPTHTLHIHSEIYGNAKYIPAQYDILNVPKQEAVIFDAVILVTTSVKDVSRHCAKIAPAVTKNTVVFVDVSGGICGLQKLISSNFTKNPVLGLIADIHAVFEQNVPREAWTIRQYGSDASSSAVYADIHGRSNAVAVTTALLAVAKQRGLSTNSASKQNVFARLQWERAIFVVAFELVSIMLETPVVEDLVQNVIAKPLVRGLITELLAVASASGVKSLPSVQTILQKSSTNVRRAASDYRIPNATRLFSEFDQHQMPYIDLLLLLPILLGAELSKCGPTPYLESLYAVMRKYLDIDQRSQNLEQLEAGVLESALFVRTDCLGKNQQSVKETTPAPETVRGPSKQEIALLDDKFKKLELRESRLEISLEDLTAREAALRTAQSQFEASELQQIEREAALAAKEEQALRKEQTLVQREQAMRKREVALSQRESEIKRSMTAASSSTAMGIPSGHPNGGQAPQPHGVNGHAPMGPMGPPTHNPAPSLSNNVHGPNSNMPISSSGQSMRKARSYVGPQMQAHPNGYAQPGFANGGGLPNPQGFWGPNKQRNGRRQSLNSISQSMGNLAVNGNGGPQMSSGFSQNFNLDSFNGFSNDNDRYGSASTKSRTQIPNSDSRNSRGRSGLAMAPTPGMGGGPFPSGGNFNNMPQRFSRAQSMTQMANFGNMDPSQRHMMPPGHQLAPAPAPAVELGNFPSFEFSTEVYRPHSSSGSGSSLDPQQSTKSQNQTPPTPTEQKQFTRMAPASTAQQT